MIFFISMLQGHRDKKVLVRQNKEEEPMEVDEISECVICMDNVQNKKTLEKCSHEFCKDCIDSHFKYKPQCPICFTAYGIVRGTQPDGYMEIKRDKRQKVPGFTEVGFIRVYYSFSDGTQGVCGMFLHVHVLCVRILSNICTNKIRQFSIFIV